MSAPTHSAVLVAVPEAGPLVDEHRLALDPSAAKGVPAHLTVLYPFVAPESLDDAVVARLRSAVSTVAAFTLTLSSTGWFGEHVLYLAPDDPEPFLRLTRAVCGAFPDHEPYDGRFDDVVPHLTIGDGAPREALRAAEADVVPDLPVVSVVGEALLMVGSDAARSWRVHSRIPLGPAG